MLNPITFDRTATSITPTDAYGPSPKIWADCPVLELERFPERGIYRFERWSDLPLAPTLTTQIAFGKYKAFATTGSSVDRVSAVNSVETLNGALKLATDTDNDSATIADAYPSFLMTGLSSNSGKLWFECCIAQKSVATNMASTFIGLAEVELWTLATGVPFNGGDAITNSAAAIGFRLKEDGLGVIDTVYSDRATSFTDIGAGEGGTLAAYTFTKLGFILDPKDPQGLGVRFFVNNVEATTRLSQAALIALTNLDANALGFIYGTVADSAGTTHEQYCKWVRIAQMFPGER